MKNRKNKRKHLILFIVLGILICCSVPITAEYELGQFWSKNGNTLVQTNITIFSNDNITFNRDVIINNETTINEKLFTTQISTGIGYTEVYLMNQNLRNIDAVTFSTVNTGFGNYEVRYTNQDTATDSDVTHNDLTLDEELYVRGVVYQDWYYLMDYFEEEALDVSVGNLFYAVDLENDIAIAYLINGEYGQEVTILNLDSVYTVAITSNNGDSNTCWSNWHYDDWVVLQYRDMGKWIFAPDNRWYQEGYQVYYY